MLACLLWRWRQSLGACSKLQCMVEEKKGLGTEARLEAGGKHRLPCNACTPCSALHRSPYRSERDDRRREYDDRRRERSPRRDYDRRCVGAAACRMIGWGLGGAGSAP